jgi:hypothetical protein
MKGLLWNIRGLNQSGRKLSLEEMIRENRLVAPLVRRNLDLRSGGFKGLTLGI